MCVGPDPLCVVVLTCFVWCCCPAFCSDPAPLHLILPSYFIYACSPTSSTPAPQLCIRQPEAHQPRSPPALTTVSSTPVAPLPGAIRPCCAAGPAPQPCPALLLSPQLHAGPAPQPHQYLLPTSPAPRPPPAPLPDPASRTTCSRAALAVKVKVYISGYGES